MPSLSLLLQFCYTLAAILFDFAQPPHAYDAAMPYKRASDADAYCRVTSCALPCCHATRDVKSDARDMLLRGWRREERREATVL